LVEDDNNLREIYEARLQAEGYETVTASDGEQALVVAKDTKPDLVISDVMMPKISGFEMLDILRNTDGLKDIKVIMLTALGQSEDKTRADQLGANKYLVKSQVTLEDIVKTAHQLLDDAPAAAPAAPAPAATDANPAPAPAAAAPTDTAAAPSPAVSSEAASMDEESRAMQAQIDSFAAEPAAAPAAEPAPAAPAEPATPATPAADPVAPAPAADPVVAAGPAPDPTAVAAHDDQVMAAAVDSLTSAADTQKPSEVTAVEVPPPAEATPAPAAPAAPAPAADSTDADESDGVTIAHKKVIKPISDGTDKPDINQLLAAEQAADTENEPVAPPPAASTVAPTPEPTADTPAAEPSDPTKPNPNDIAL
jgi:DNA-binding response OmpR family regulator